MTWSRLLRCVVAAVSLGQAAAAEESPPEFLLSWGSRGSGAGQFLDHYGIAVDANGDVYVADAGNNRIQKFDSEGSFIGTWGSFGSADGQFDYPLDVHVDAEGFVYVSDSFNSRVQKFTSDGVFLAKWGSLGTDPGEFIDPMGVATDAAGNVYVVDYPFWGFPPGPHRVQKFTSDGVYLAEWGSYGLGDGQFAQPWGIAVDANNDVYVVEQANYRVQKFTSAGVFLGKWGSQGSGDGQFEVPMDLAVDSGNNIIYVADSDNSRMQKFTSDGLFLVEWGSMGSGNGQFAWPRGVAVAASGKIYVVDGYRVQKFGGPPTDTREGQPARETVGFGAPWPNPTRSCIQLVQGQPGRVMLHLYDVRGRRLFATQVPEVQGNVIRWDLDTERRAGILTPGIYFLRVTAGGASRVHKVTVAK